MAGARNVDRAAFLDDRHMWRQLLAKVHPDAGGNHELFLFASAVREGICGQERSARGLAGDNAGGRTEHFPRTWREAMTCWALRNREALKTV